MVPALGGAAVLGNIESGTSSGDYYSIPVAAVNLLILRTATPGDGPGEFVNTLDPKIELYDPAGTLVASNDNGTRTAIMPC